MAYLCVAIFVSDSAQARRDSILAAEAGADLLELRIDNLTEAVDLPDIPLPYIVTCRSKREGGLSELADEDRINLLASPQFAGAAYVDLELQTLVSMPDACLRLGRPIIQSAHDFTGRPDRLYNMIRAMNSSPAGVNKIVWRARSVRDNIEAFELLQSRQKPTIALCMGEAGLISRILAPKFGAFLSFASLRQAGATAPGQVPVDEMKRLYRWDSIGPQTKVFGVVGCPVGHSMSPAIHNAAFDHIGFDGVYLPLLVQPGYESFKAFMESFLAFDALHLSGLSITIPHKENALRYLLERGAEVEDLAMRIGAVNTILIQAGAGGAAVRGMNTDYAAILDTITSALGISRDDLSTRRVAVIGAGGTGRTAVAALASCGATVVIYNRTQERADALAAEFNGRSGKVVAAPLKKLRGSCCQIYINATSVGMSPDVDATPLDESAPAFNSRTLVFDSIYNPLETKLLRQAASQGAMVVGGIEMFVRQAASQFQAWTGAMPPVDLMREIVKQRLQPATKNSS